MCLHRSHRLFCWALDRLSPPSYPRFIVSLLKQKYSFKIYNVHTNIVNIDIFSLKACSVEYLRFRMLWMAGTHFGISSSLSAHVPAYFHHMSARVVKAFLIRNWSQHHSEYINMIPQIFFGSLFFVWHKEWEWPFRKFFSMDLWNMTFFPSHRQQYLT